MDANLEFERTRLTLRHLAQHSSLSDAERLLKLTRETTEFLLHRIAREKRTVAETADLGVSSNVDEFFSMMG